MLKSKILPLLIAPLLFLSLIAQGVSIAEANTGLIKGSSSSVYYLGQDRVRYGFPDSQTYFTWYSNFNNVTQVSNTILASYPLGRTVTVRPGTTMVKIQTDPKVYAVSQGGILRWVETEEIARQLYGNNWNQHILDIPVGIFFLYTEGQSISDVSQYSPESEVGSTLSIDENREPPDIIDTPAPGEPSTPIKPQWQTRIDELNLDYTSGFSGKGYFVEQGPYRVTLPDRGDEHQQYYALFRLHQLKVCYDAIENILGTRPEPLQQMWEETQFSGSSVSYCCGEESDGTPIVNLTIQEAFDDIVHSDTAYWKSENADINVCLGGHEEVHRYVRDTYINSRFNEGIAQYVEETLRDNPGTLASRNLISCGEDSFTISSGETIPYRDLFNEFYDAPGIYGYYTAACFWDHIDRNYGRTALQGIMLRLFTPGENANNGSEYFFHHAVIPVIGTNIQFFVDAMLDDWTISLLFNE